MRSKEAKASEHRNAGEWTDRRDITKSVFKRR